MPKTKPLYVEIAIRAELDLLWALTQQPHRHQRWDARFSRIDWLSPPPADGPARFRYELGWRPGPVLTGVGTTAVERRRPDGSRISALRFRSDSRLSPLQEGSGYWRYLPDSSIGAVRFITGYDYRSWPGPIGTRVDRHCVRPLVGWLTAWSFDRLRLWAEHGITPERALRNCAAEVLIRLGVVGLSASLVGATGAALAALLAIAAPPSARTPAARRCTRTRTGGRTSGGDLVPKTLTALESP